MNLAKRILIFVAVLSVLFCCGCDLSGGTKYVKMTFRQEGCEDVVRMIPYGGNATGIPVPKQKEGYTVVWEDFNKSALKSDIVIHAVETPKVYTVTYDLNGYDATIDSLTDTATYDAVFIPVTPVGNGLTFVCWKLKESDEAYYGGVYKFTSDIVLVAYFASDAWSDYH